MCIHMYEVKEIHSNCDTTEVHKSSALWVQLNFSQSIVRSKAKHGGPERYFLRANCVAELQKGVG